MKKKAIPFFIFYLILVSLTVQIRAQDTIRTYKHLTIDKNTEISDEATITASLTIRNGSVLTIKGKLLMRPGAKIIVKPGGKLILDACTLTNACNGLWQGVEVLGDPTSPVSDDQGHLSMGNGATIENAEVAIRNYSPDEPGKEGGWVDVENAIFRNNEVAVDFRDYPFTNLSLFKDCEFVIDTAYFGNTFTAFVELSDIEGPPFSTCTFENLKENPIGTGINSSNANFYVVKNSLFDKLAYGIKAIGSGSTLGSHIRQSTFTNNFRGLYISGIDDMDITENTFHVSPSYPGLSIGQDTYGAYLDHCTGYTLEGNQFTSYDLNSKGRVGLYIKDSGGDDNMVYDNTFDKLMYGTVAYGGNNANGGPISAPKGLCYKCNEFTDNDNDIAVLAKEKGQGIKPIQGSDIAQPDAPAGNRFSWTGPEGTPTDINNEGAHVTYWYPSNTSVEHVIPLYVTDNTVTVSPNYYPGWNLTTGCPPPSSGGGGGKSSLQDEMATSSLKADSVQNILDLLVDGGETEATELNVQTSYPPESYAVYNDLMGKSPYLSPAVVDASIEKEDVLPNVMIRDVMVANPQSAKEDALIDKLDERGDPMPDYMLAQILQGRSLVGYMEELQSQKAYYGQKRTLAFNGLVKLYLQDSTLQQAAVTDSLIVLFSGENNLSAQYRLAMLYYDKGAYTEGQSILNDIPNSFQLGDAQNTAHNYFVDFYDIIIEVAQNGGGLTEGEIADLEILAGAEVGLASAYSRNLLIAMDGMEYIEPVILPDFTKSASAEAEYNALMKALKEHHYLKVFPNPAKDYVIIEYTLEMEYDNAVLKVYNNNGVLQQTLRANNKTDQKVINTKALDAGIYIVSLNVNGKEMESVKFTIIK